MTVHGIKNDSTFGCVFEGKAEFCLLNCHLGLING